MQFIRPKQVMALIGVSKATLWRMVRAGRFPAPVRIGAFSKAYVLEEVQAWMAAVAEQRAARVAPGESATGSKARHAMAATRRSRTHSGPRARYTDQHSQS